MHQICTCCIACAIQLEIQAAADDMAILGQANYIHSLASATSLHYMRAGGNLIAVVRGTQCSINIHAHIQDTAEYSLDALPRLQLGATPLKFGPNQLEVWVVTTSESIA